MYTNIQKTIGTPKNIKTNKKYPVTIKQSYGFIPSKLHPHFRKIILQKYYMNFVP